MKENAERTSLALGFTVHRTATQENKATLSLLDLVPSQPTEHPLMSRTTVQQCNTLQHSTVDHTTLKKVCCSYTPTGNQHGIRMLFIAFAVMAKTLNPTIWAKSAVCVIAICGACFLKFSNEQTTLPLHPPPPLPLPDPQP